MKNIPYTAYVHLGKKRKQADNQSSTRSPSLSIPMSFPTPADACLSSASSMLIIQSVLFEVCGPTLNSGCSWSLFLNSENKLGQMIYFPAQRTDSSRAGRRLRSYNVFTHRHLEFILHRFIKSIWFQALFTKHWVCANMIITSALGVKVTLESGAAARVGERESLGQRRAGGPHL